MNKVNLSSMRVLQMLELLFEKSYTMNELMEALSQVTGERCSNFLVCKYINTCRFCGIDIQKINGKYMLLRLPFGIDFSDDEFNLINDINEFCKDSRITKTVRGVNSLLGKLNRRSNKYYSRITVPEEDGFIENFETALEGGNMIELKFKENDNIVDITCEPVSIFCEEGILGFIINDVDARKKILYSDIEELKVSSKKVNKAASQSPVVFKLKSNLAQRYTLRPDEKIVATEFDGSISVSNRTEDKDTLLKRLLKYGDMCELVSPRTYRRDMRNIIVATLKNYEQSK